MAVNTGEMSGKKRRLSQRFCSSAQKLPLVRGKKWKKK
jgi:hypothetical protein